MRQNHAAACGASDPADRIADRRSDMRWYKAFAAPLTRWGLGAVAVAVAGSFLSPTCAFAPSRALPARSGRLRPATSVHVRAPPMHMGLRDQALASRRGARLRMQGAGGRRDAQSGTRVSDREVEDQENGFDPFFTLSEGILHAEATQLRSWPPPMPASVRQFEEKVAAAEAELKWAFLSDQTQIEDAARRERQEWMASWMKAKPQESIARLKLKRDRWVPLDIPMSAKGISEMLENPYVQLVLSDPEQRNYWIYATGRTIFFFSSSVLSALLQINVAPTWNAFDYGANYRREVALALKRVAMSGERKDSGEFESAKKIPTIERVFRLFGSVFELYRRDCSNIAFGIYRYPYDASLRHRQFNPFFVRRRFLNTLAESVATGVRRAKGEQGKREIKKQLLLREAQALGGVVLVDDPLSEPENLINDRLLLGNTSIFPDYYLQNFHWQTDGWLSTRSAASYEYTTESLFSGCQDAMQRQSLVSISEYVALRKGVVSEKDISLLDVAAGTGRQHTFIKDNWPKMKTVCSDLSPFYLKQAYENFEYFAEFTKAVTGREITRPEFVQAKAEDLPFANTTFDIVTCTYLFHEIPFPVRKEVAAEMFRVTKPGGICVITDSFQKGDFPERDHIGRRFPANYHEPYYNSYFENTDLVKMFLECGFVMRRHQCAHLSKVLTFDKPDPNDTDISSRRLASMANEADGARWAVI